MSSSIEAAFKDKLKDAMKARDQRVLNVIRAIRTKIGEAKTAKGFSGEINDELYLKVIAAYVKSMTKAIAEFEKAGSDSEQVDQLRFEVEYLSPYLPQKLGEAETRAIVEKVIAESGVDSIKQVGRIMGMVMKDHRDSVDAGLVRSIAESILD